MFVGFRTFKFPYCNKEVLTGWRRKLDFNGYNFCDERFVFHANAVIQTDVEDLPTEAIQRTNSLIGPYLTCPRDIDGSESVRPFPSVVLEIACQNYLRTTFWGVLRKTSA